MQSYTLISGETIEFEEPSPLVAAFVQFARAAAADPAVDIHRMTELVYGNANPILDYTRVPGRGLITRAVLDNPIYQVLSDLVGVKRIQLGLLDMEKVSAAYTITLKDAAKQLGMTQAAVRAALTSRRLDGLLRNGQWFLRPNSIASFQFSNRILSKNAANGTNGSGRTVKRQKSAG